MIEVEEQKTKYRDLRDKYYEGFPAGDLESFKVSRVHIYPRRGWGS